MSGDTLVQALNTMTSTFIVLTIIGVLFVIVAVYAYWTLKTELTDIMAVLSKDQRERVRAMKKARVTRRSNEIHIPEGAPRWAEPTTRPPRRHS